MTHIRFLLLVGLVCAVFPLSSCVLGGLAAGTAGVATASAKSEGGLKGTISDFKIQAQINDLWWRSNVEMFSKLDLTVNDGRVLITGVVQDPEHRVEAVRLAWQPEGVRQVINEIRVAESEGIVGHVRDAWITTRARAAITFDKETSTIDYTLDTVQGTLYVMGVARNDMELERLLEVLRNVSGVKQVVSYVKLSSELDGPADGE